MELLSSRMPLVIGVTGHRDLREQDITQLEHEVGAIISRLRLDYIGEANETPIILISALAEGADRVVARVALKMGVKLIAPLPLPIAEYRHDFEPGLNPNAANEFDFLLSQACSVPIMPFTANNSLEAVRNNADKRAEQYRAVGLFIVKYCNVLLALWDGDEADIPVGGTTEVVSFKREGIPLTVSGSAHASLDGSEIGPVIHVVTPRKKSGNQISDVVVFPWGVDIIRRHRGSHFRQILNGIAVFSASLFAYEKNSSEFILPPPERRDLQRWETFNSLISLTCEFNNEAATLEATPGGSVDTLRSIDSLFEMPDEDHVDSGARQYSLIAASHLSHLFGVADTLANNRHVQFRNDWKFLLILSFIAFVFYALFSHVGWASNWLLGGYAFAVGIIFYVFVRAHLRRDQERFLDYRALAEALRVAVYWNILGMDRNNTGERDKADESLRAEINTIGTLASRYPIKQPSELAWIKVCLRTLDLWPNIKPNFAEYKINPDAYNFVRRFWVCGQLLYFERQGTKHNRNAEFLEGWALIVLFFTPFFLVPLLISAIGDGKYLGLRLHDAFLISIGLLPGLAATLSSYSERLALKAQARQYDRMRMLFERAYSLLPDTVDATSESDVRSLYRELGAEAMKENADWVAIYRQRPIRPVQ
jgi:hypothetical protein